MITGAKCGLLTTLLALFICQNKCNIFQNIDDNNTDDHNVAVQEKHCVSESDKNGEYFLSKVNVSSHDQPCITWAEADPCMSTSELYDKTYLAENYCSNPDGSKIPWCYTTFLGCSRSDCAICPVIEPEFDSSTDTPSVEPQFDSSTDTPGAEPQFDSSTDTPGADNDHGAVLENMCVSESDKVGKYYLGQVNVTSDGYSCITWEKAEPCIYVDARSSRNSHGNNYLEKNYCRNPYDDTIPWCYVDVDECLWSHCDICPVDDNHEWAVKEKPCVSESDKVGDQYLGDVSVTSSGETCITWDDATPCTMGTRSSGHTFNDTLEENYCRNPDGDSTPWCYTQVYECVWSYCDICPANETESDFNKNIHGAGTESDFNKAIHGAGCTGNGVSPLITCGTFALIITSLLVTWSY